MNKKDYLLWVETIVKQLEQKDVDNLDWQHLIEEIEALGIEQKHKVDSYLFRLLLVKLWILII